MLYYTYNNTYHNEAFNIDFKEQFLKLAEEMERECGDWQSLPENPELVARIMAEAARKEMEHESVHGQHTV